MDTPFAFSTATSMSDLREPAIQEEEEGEAQEEEEEEEEPEEKEVTVQYAVEGTPLAFSRAESLSDLELEAGEGEGAKLQAIPETGEEKGMAETEGEKSEEGPSKMPPPREKTVTFCGSAEVQSAPQETPMMFSRASSVASLDSFEHEGSLQDGYSSYEASRATSGRVSPSDLPDSPSQTMPASPRPRPGPKRPAPPPSAPPLAPAHQKSVYADVVMSYQEEGTPAVFSTRTSLSGLEFEDEEKENDAKKEDDGAATGLSTNTTLSDDEDIYADSESLLGQLITSAMPESKPPPRSRLPKPRAAWASPRTASESPRPVADPASDDSSCSADQQDLLASCIASAMPVPASRLGPRQAAEGAPAPAAAPKAGRRRGAVPPPRQPPAPPERKGSHLSHPCVAAAAAASQDDCGGARPPADTVRCWGVEGTPIHFSAATSLSDLAVEEPTPRPTLLSGRDTPRAFMTEDTPAVFSRNDSLSSLESDTERSREPGRGNAGRTGYVSFTFPCVVFQLTPGQRMRCTDLRSHIAASPLQIRPQPFAHFNTTREKMAPFFVQTFVVIKDLELHSSLVTESLITWFRCSPAEQAGLGLRLLPRLLPVPPPPALGRRQVATGDIHWQWTI
jgi:adenomatosis polyposis coli protein